MILNVRPCGFKVIGVIGYPATIPLSEMPRPLPVPVACKSCRCAVWPDMPNVQMLHMLYIGCHPMLFWNEQLRFSQPVDSRRTCFLNNPDLGFKNKKHVRSFCCRRHSSIIWLQILVRLSRFLGKDYSQPTVHITSAQPN